MEPTTVANQVHTDPVVLAATIGILRELSRLADDRATRMTDELGAGHLPGDPVTAAEIEARGRT